MSGWNQELIPLSEETLGKALDTAVSITTSRPIKNGKYGRHSNGIDLFILCDK